LEAGHFQFPDRAWRAGHTSFCEPSIVDFLTPNRLNRAQLSQIIHTVNF
jgi:hypothetical protein